MQELLVLNFLVPLVLASSSKANLAAMSRFSLLPTELVAIIVDMAFGQYEQVSRPSDKVLLSSIHVERRFRSIALQQKQVSRTIALTLVEWQPRQA